MTDEHFLASLRDCSLPPGQFSHLGHLRLGCLQLQRHPFEQAVDNTCTLIRAYAEHLGAAGKFHWTITEALLHLLRAAGAANAPSWSGFARANPQLVTQAQACLSRHYSAHCLASDAARSGFVAPDLAPLPC